MFLLILLFLFGLYLIFASLHYREKVWKDCPSCGKKNSMEYRTDQTEIFGKKIVVSGLNGYYCKTCNDCVFTNASTDKINGVLSGKKNKLL